MESALLFTVAGSAGIVVISSAYIRHYEVAEFIRCLSHSVAALQLSHKMAKIPHCVAIFGVDCCKACFMVAASPTPTPITRGRRLAELWGKRESSVRVRGGSYGIDM